jgi:cytochrome P450
MTTLVSTASDRVTPTSGIGAQFKPFEHHGMYAFFARAGAEEPVFFCPDINYWVVTTREDILHMLQDATRFSADIALAPVTPLVPEALAILKAGMGAAPMQVNCDPPKHDRIRRIAGRFLNAKRFQMLEPDIRRLAREALGALDGRAEVDLVADLVYEFPARVLFLLMGIPADHAPRIKRWADYRLLITFGDLSAEEQLRGAENMVAYWRYCVAMVEDRLRRPLSDYASFLIAHRGEVEPALSDNEIASLMFGLLIAGHETTSNLSANALLALLSHRPSWQAISSDISLIPDAVEEVLRFASSVVCWRRRTRGATVVQGVTIPANANVLLALGAANYDAGLFPEPDRFDISRPNAREHVSFGKGVHFCMGAPLARLELKVLLEEIVTRYPALALLEEQHVEYIRTIAFRGPKRLIARLGSRSVSIPTD